MSNVNSKNTRRTSLSVVLQTTLSLAAAAGPVALSLVLGAGAVLTAPRSSKAEDAVATGWINSSDTVTCFSEVRSDGRLVTVTVNNGVNLKRGVHGLIYHVYLSGSTPKHVAYPAAELGEFDPRAYTQGATTYKISWSSLTSWYDKIKKWIDRARKFVDKLNALTNPLKALCKLVCELMSELGLDWCERIRDVAGDGPVAVFAGYVKDSAFNPARPSLHYKVSGAMYDTLARYKAGSATRKAIVSAFHAGLMEQY